MTRIHCSMTAVAALLAAPVALAQKSTSATTYKEALKLESAGNFAAALQAFESFPVGQRLVVTRLHIARCESKLGRMHDAERELIALDGDPKLEEAERETVASELAFVRDRMPKLAIKVAEVASGATVTLDGNPVSTPLTTSVDPGVHAVVAMKSGVEIYRRDVKVEEGQAVTVDIDAPPSVSTATAKTPPPPDTTATPASSGTTPHAPIDMAEASKSPTAAYVLGAVGIGFLAGSIAARFEVNAAHDERRAACLGQGTPTCDDTGVGKMRAWETISFAAGGLAIASLGGAIYLLASQPKGGPVGEVSAFVRVVPTTAGIRLEGTF